MAVSMIKSCRMLSVLRCASSKLAQSTHRLRSASTVAGSFKCSELEIELCKNPRPKPDPKTLSFGSEFSDHWLVVDWSSKDGWETPKIAPLQEMKIHPAAKVFHYAIELYEGLKAYRGIDNTIRIFRPDCNMKRMISTAERSTLPYDFDGGELTECIRKLVGIDREWVPASNQPYSTSPSLYIRPCMIATEPCLGVSKPENCRLFVMTGPVGPYYPTGFKPISLLADPSYVRAFEGGCGRYKMGSNYAPTIYIQIEALKSEGCQQVLWLYGPDHRITEAGTMNFFMYWTNAQGEKELVTPPLDSGVILPGVTRASLLDLARSWGDFKVTERELTMPELVQGLNDKRVHEVFGSGTACVVSAVERIVYNGKPLSIPTMDEGAPITTRFLTELTDIQFGKKKSSWMVDVN